MPAPAALSSIVQLASASRGKLETILPPDLWATAGRVRDRLPAGERAGFEAAVVIGWRALADAGLARRSGAGWDVAPPVGGRPNVVVKPNFVRHYHGEGSAMEPVLVSAGVLGAALFLAAVMAERWGGEVTLGDAPLQDGDFQRIAGLLGLADLLAAHRAVFGREPLVADFRTERGIRDRHDLVIAREPLAGDPRGFTEVDLGERSQHVDIEQTWRRYRVTQYDKARMRAHHSPGVHKYLISGSVLDAGLLFSVPKLKTHRKAGLTGALKNLVGMNGSKDWLPHHRLGSIRWGGDEYLRPSWRKYVRSRLLEVIDAGVPALPRYALQAIASLVWQSKFVLPFPDPYIEGSWWGNQTIPRTIADLNAIAYHVTPDGVYHDEPVREVITLLDAVVAGEGEGPLEPDPVPLGLVLGGRCSWGTDLVAARLMGFNPRRIPSLTIAQRALRLTGELQVEDAGAAGEALAVARGEHRAMRSFVPASGWRGYIDRFPEEEPRRPSRPWEAPLRTARAAAL